jgi:peptidoglycan/xylan/chitin deacetylase (PgdA/CDA1 family)
MSDDVAPGDVQGRMRELNCIMGSRLAALKTRIGNRLARHFLKMPHPWPANQPMVSFTFDDVPESAATLGAPMLEDFGGHGTFYVAGSLVNRRSDHWNGIHPDQIVALHRKSHEIGCHTFSHRITGELDAAAMTAEIATNRDYFETLDASIRLENFAYPYGFASLTHKKRLKQAFRSSRGILPGVNRGVVDLHFLRAMPLITVGIDDAAIDRAFDNAVETGGWLIFYTHDVAASPSPYGCTPALLRHALQAASRRHMPIVSVAEALRRAGA